MRAGTGASLEDEEETGALRSPRVRRRRISTRSLGSLSRDWMNAPREADEPEVEVDVHDSNKDCRVGAYHVSWVS